jgi:hypothetical protein
MPTDWAGCQARAIRACASSSGSARSAATAEHERLRPLRLSGRLCDAGTKRVEQGATIPPDPLDSDGAVACRRSCSQARTSMRHNSSCADPPH